MKYVSLISALLFAAMLFFPTEVSSYVREHLALCGSAIVPSLFVFTVLSEMFVGEKMFNAFSKLFSKLHRPFGMGSDGMAVFVISALCGSPYGAKTADSLYSRTRITAKQMIITVCASNNAGLAFMLAAGEARVYCLQLVAALLCAVILNSIVNEREIRCEGQVNAKGKTSLTQAVTSGAYVMLGVCACVVFFGTVGRFLTSFIPGAERLKGFFEFSSGVLEASRTPGKSSELWACAFANFSGLSVHAQVDFLTGKHKIYRYFAFSKLLQTVLSLILCYLLLLFTS